MLNKRTDLLSGLSPRVIVILCTTLPLAILLIIVMGAVHCILQRHKRQMQEKLDAEKGPHQPLPSPQRPRIEVIPNAITTNYPIIGVPLTQAWTQPIPLQPTPLPNFTLLRSHATVGHGHARNANPNLQPPLPVMPQQNVALLRSHTTSGHGHTRTYNQEIQPQNFAPVRSRSTTVGHSYARNTGLEPQLQPPLQNKAPVRSRTTIAHNHVRNTRQELQPPMQTYDPATRRTLYWG